VIQLSNDGLTYMKSVIHKWCVWHSKNGT